MEEVLDKNNSKKYGFSNKESQRLFVEFTHLLGEITERIENKENLEKIYVRGDLSSYRSRELLREVYSRFVISIKDKKIKFLQKFKKDNLKSD